MLDLEKRYQKVIKDIGGAPALLELPEKVKSVLKRITDLETKVHVLEKIVEEKLSQP